MHQQETVKLPRNRRGTPPPRDAGANHQPDPRATRGRGARPDAPAPPRSRPAQPGEPTSLTGQRPSGPANPLPPYTPPRLPTEGHQPGVAGPKKMTVTRVAALRSRQLTSKGVELFRKAATADGADRSGLTHLTYAVMANYAIDAALMVGLANTLFFAAAAGESTGKVLLYLLITVAPFAVIAPFIGPLLDKLQHGRRIALAASAFGRALLAIVMAFNFDSWMLYPCALLAMVLSKSFGVLKAALTPRVLPEQITLVKTNSRLTVFGLAAGGVSGAIAGGLAGLTSSAGALLFTAACAIVGGVLCLRIPAWVESTDGEVPIQHSQVLYRDPAGHSTTRVFPPPVSATLWANMANRIETGFLALFIAFVVKTEYADTSGFGQLLLLGAVGAAAGIGGFIGNGLGAQLSLGQPEKLAFWSVSIVGVTTLLTVAMPGLPMAVVVGLIGSASSSLAKVCLDSVIQRDLPEVSRASAFGRSESALQLAWVFGGVVGLLLGGVAQLHGRPVYMIGFAVVTVLLALALIQSYVARSGRSLLPAEALPWRRPGRGRRAGGAGVSGGSAAFGGVAVPGGSGISGYQAADAGPATKPDPSAVEQPAALRPKKQRRRAGDPR